MTVAKPKLNYRKNSTVILLKLTSKAKKRRKTKCHSSCRLNGIAKRAGEANRRHTAKIVYHTLPSFCNIFLKFQENTLKRRIFFMERDQKRVRYILRSYITLKDGRRIYASSYGKKAFCIPIYD